MKVTHVAPALVPLLVDSVKCFAVIECVPAFQKCRSIYLENYYSKLFQNAPFDIAQDKKNKIL